MAVHLATLGEEVKDGEIVVKMLRSLPPRFKQITITIKTLLDVSTMSVADLTGRLKEAKEAFEKHRHHCIRMGSCTSPRRSGTCGGRNARRRTTPAATQEAVAVAKAVGAAGVTVAAALHQVGHRASPPVISVGAAARWGIGRVSAARSPGRSRRTSRKMRRRPRSCSRQQP
jgi:ribosomal protein S11